VHGPALEAAKKAGKQPSSDVLESVDEMRADYEHQLEARYAGARGYIDTIVYPEETRDVLTMAFRTALHNAGPHLGAFVLPPHLSEA
jgi:acetyl-CoA carboxylase carboxyltransferase component